MKHAALALATVILSSLESRAAPWTFLQEPAQAAREWLARWSDQAGLQRWKAFVADVESDPAKRNDLLTAARGLGEFAFLEELVLYSRSAEAACRELAQADAPAWPRCAAWCLARMSDSHTFQTARDLLLRQPELALGWFHANPPRNVHERSLLAELEGKDLTVRTDGRYLPAFDPQRVFAALEPGAASAGKAADGPLAIERALEGYAHLYEHAEPWRGWVLAATRHTDAGVRSAAYRAMTRFQPQEVPMEELWMAVEDPSLEPAMRELALLSFSFGPEIATYARLHGVVSDASHPAWRAAVSRLGDVGDEFTLAIFDQLPRAALTEAGREQLAAERKRVAERLAGQEPERAKRVQGLLERAAWADLTCHPLELQIVDSMQRTLKSWTAAAAVREELRRLAATYVPAEAKLGQVHPDDMARRVREYARQLARV